MVPALQITLKIVPGFEIMPMKAGTGTDPIQLPGYAQSFSRQTTQYCSNFPPPWHCKIKNRLTNRPTLKMINLRAQVTYNSGKVPFKNKLYADYTVKSRKWKIGNTGNRNNGICNKKWTVLEKRSGASCVKLSAREAVHKEELGAYFRFQFHFCCGLFKTLLWCSQTFG